MQNKLTFLVGLAIVLGVIQPGLAKDENTPQNRVIKVNLEHVEKNLNQSYLGSDAEDFATGFDFNWMLTEGRSQFAAYCRETGTRVLRLGNMSRYSVRSERVTRMVRARRYAEDNDKLYQNLMKTPLEWWFKPEDFYSFCRAQGIDVIPMLTARTYYDPDKDEAYYFIDKPEHYDAAAKEAAHQVKWVKDHGFLDQVVAWEVGNETYMRWDPTQYAQYLRKVIQNVRKIDPDIKLSVPIFICEPGDPDLLQRNGQDDYDQWMAWTRKMFKVLGSDAKYLTYGVTHFYGAAITYNSNYRGIAAHDDLLKSIPNAKHLKMINTEWRFTSGDNLTGHLRYDIGGLWTTKFALTLMAYPNMEYTGLHSFLWFGGLGMWSNGDSWVQRPGPKDRKGLVNDPQNRRRFALGPFAAPQRFCNTLIDDYPLLLKHGAGLGDYSSARYYKHQIDSKDGSDEGSDLEWFVATDPERSAVASIFVNTTSSPIRVKLDLMNGSLDPQADTTVQTYWCDPGKIAWTAPPGVTSQLHLSKTEQPASAGVTVPPFGIVKAVSPLQQ